MKTEVAVVIPNWNGKKLIGKCLSSLKNQSIAPFIIVVDNGSTDGSADYIKNKHDDVLLIKNTRNLGFAGGVNTGIKHALSEGYEYIALLNNDAVVDKDWLANLLKTMGNDSSVGAATGLIMAEDGKTIDNTGDGYSTWGLSISRDRGKPEALAAKAGHVFGACAGSSLFRASVFNSVGLFDEKFFAYYEDTDLNFRMQLAGWKVKYTPKALTHHATGSTGGKIKGFTTYQTVKNLPMLFWRNVPVSFMWCMLPRFSLAYFLIIGKAVLTGRGWPAIRGLFSLMLKLPHIVSSRYKIQNGRKVSDDYMWSVLTHDLPPSATSLRRLRAFFTGR